MGLMTQRVRARSYESKCWGFKSLLPITSLKGKDQSLLPITGLKGKDLSLSVGNFSSR